MGVFTSIDEALVGDLEGLRRRRAAARRAHPDQRDRRARDRAGDGDPTPARGGVAVAVTVRLRQGDWLPRAELD